MIIKENVSKLFSSNDFKDELYEIFKLKIVKRQNFAYGVLDETILLKTCIELLNVIRAKS